MEQQDKRAQEQGGEDPRTAPGAGFESLDEAAAAKRDRLINEKAAAASRRITGDPLPFVAFNGDPRAPGSLDEIMELGKEFGKNRLPYHVIACGDTDTGFCVRCGKLFEDLLVQEEPIRSKGCRSWLTIARDRVWMMIDRAEIWESYARFEEKLRSEALRGEALRGDGSGEALPPAGEAGSERSAPQAAPEAAQAEDLAEDPEARAPGSDPHDPLTCPFCSFFGLIDRQKDDQEKDGSKNERISFDVPHRKFDKKAPEGLSIALLQAENERLVKADKEAMARAKMQAEVVQRLLKRIDGLQSELKRFEDLGRRGWFQAGNRQLEINEIRRENEELHREIHRLNAEIAPYKASSGLENARLKEENERLNAEIDKLGADRSMLIDTLQKERIQNDAERRRAQELARDPLGIAGLFRISGTRPLDRGDAPGGSAPGGSAPDGST